MPKKTEESELAKIEAELKKVGSKIRKEQRRSTDEFIKKLDGERMSRDKRKETKNG
jgi:hypothetical protein